MSKKGENIHKRKDGRWEGRYKKSRDQNGRIVYGSIYAKTYRETRDKLHDAIIAASASDKERVTTKMVFAELLALWQKSNDIRLKGATKNKYVNLIEAHILPFLGQMPISELTATLINEFLSKKLKSGRLDGSGGLSASYVRGMALIISSALKYGAIEGLCEPIKGRILKPTIPKCELTVLTPDLQKSLEEAIASEISPTGIGIIISLYTGLRIGEICALKWSDVDLDRGVLYVRHTVARVRSDGSTKKTLLIIDQPKTPSSRRTIPISPMLSDLLLKYRAISPSPYVVSDKESFLSPRTYESRFHRFMARLGVDKCSYHMLRHTFATRCIQAGVDVKSLSEILGHADASITLNTYVHSSLETKIQQLEKLTFYINDENSDNER